MTARKGIAGTTVALLLVGATVHVTVGRAEAGRIGSVAFADRVESDGAELRLTGLGRVRYMRIWEVYVGGLYLPPGVAADEVLGEVPKRLEFRYSRDVRADQLTRAADEFLSRNLAPGVIARVRPAIDRINRLYRDVREGDRYALTYLPGRGTRLELNGETLGIVEGDEFAAAYYSIWLGENPLSRDFKADVLGDT